MSTDQCCGFGTALWECRYFFPKPCVRWSKMCTGQLSFCLPVGSYFSLSCFDWFFALLLFCFLDKAGIFVGSSIVVPPAFPFFSPFFTISIHFFALFFVCFLFLPSYSPFSSSAFIMSSFLLRICVYIFPFCWFPFHFLECFLWRSFFPPFFILIFTLGAKVSKCISESFGRFGYIPCRIGKDGGFIRRGRSISLPRINLAKAGRCMTDTL